MWQGIRAVWKTIFAAHRPSEQAEPAHAVQDALRRLRRLSARGVIIPDEVMTAILVARRELIAQGGVVGPATGGAFYDACRKLAFLAARADEYSEIPLGDPYARATVNSELLLKFAAESGTEVPADVRADLLAGQTRLGEQPNDLIKARFYSAYAALSQRLGDVTADTIKACRSPRTRRALKRDVTIAIVLAILTVIISIALFTAEAINTQLKEEIATANDLAIKLRGTIYPVLPANSAPVEIRKEYVEEPCSALAMTPQPHEYQVKSQADLDQIQAFAVAVRDARSRAGRLNGFILFSECDPYGSCWWGNAAHNKAVKAMWALDAHPRIHDRFELNPTLSNFTAEFLCKVQTWQEVRDFAVNIQKSYGATFGGLVAYGLPILYALLGAYAYRLRQFGETVRNRTFHPSFADSARLITAIIAGSVAGLFSPVRDLTVSPLAVAFLVGYGVEIFFRFLDSLLNSFGSGSPSRPARQPTGPAQMPLPQQ